MADGQRLRSVAPWLDSTASGQELPLATGSSWSDESISWNADTLTKRHVAPSTSRHLGGRQSNLEHFAVQIAASRRSINPSLFGSRASVEPNADWPRALTMPRMSR